MVSIGFHVLIVCPYEDCGNRGATDLEFKREKHHTSVFICPKCQRRFIAFLDRRGKIIYTKQRRHKEQIKTEPQQEAITLSQRGVRFPK
jgi:hypothetical protein